MMTAALAPTTPRPANARCSATAQGAQDPHASRLRAARALRGSQRRAGQRVGDLCDVDRLDILSGRLKPCDQLATIVRPAA
jgi:hypothetical protein